MPPGFAQDKPVWLVYELVALSPSDEADGVVDFEQSFEGIKTPLPAFHATYKAG